LYGRPEFESRLGKPEKALYRAETLRITRVVIDQDLPMNKPLKYPTRNFLKVEIYITYFVPQMALSQRLDVISQGPKKNPFPGPNPLPLALVMDLPGSKALRMRPYKSYVHK
jgi:hypothetical protein